MTDGEDMTLFGGDMRNSGYGKDKDEFLADMIQLALPGNLENGLRQITNNKG